MELRPYHPDYEKYGEIFVGGEAEATQYLEEHPLLAFRPFDPIDDRSRIGCRICKRGWKELQEPHDCLEGGKQAYIVILRRDPRAMKMERNL